MTQITESNMSLIAEYRLLNAIFLNPEIIDKEGLTEDIFIRGISKTFFRTIEHLKEENVKPTELAIYQYASGVDVNVKQDTIREIFDLNSDANVDVKDMVETLAYVKKSSEALKLMSDVESLVNKNPRRSDAVEDQIRQKMAQAEDLLLSNITLKRTSNAEELEQQYIEDYDLRKNGKRYRFYNKILDDVVTYGPNPGNGGLICAATGMGKSAYCLNLINGFAVAGVPFMYYTLEMGNVDTTDRLMALRTGIPVNDFVSPPDVETWADNRDKIVREFDDLKKTAKMRISECASVSLFQIKQDVLKFQKDIGQQYFILVVDLLSMIKEFMITDSRGVNFAQGITVAVNTLNAMAKELGFHWIGTLQIGRKAEEGRIDDLKDIERYRPKRTDIKDSNSYLERCRYSISLFRKRYYAEVYLPKELYEDMQDVVEVSLMKQNQGKIGRCGALLFEPECMRMTPLEDEDLQQEDEQEDA